MDADKIITELEGLQPPQIDYAEMVGFPVPASYGCCWVWEYPEPYIIQNGIDLIRQQITELAAAQSKIAELTAELEAKEMDYNALQESYINSGMNLKHLQSHDKKAMELLELAYRSVGRFCDNCIHRSNCKLDDCVTKWRWQHVYRYEELKSEHDLKS